MLTLRKIENVLTGPNNRPKARCENYYSMKCTATLDFAPCVVVMSLFQPLLCPMDSLKSSGPVICCIDNIRLGMNLEPNSLPSGFLLP
ncbi:hypothetical protein BGY98DRAFT_708200 [Russula aff. rugulosa BPL654]|nr:hypothetical protein BGY98DRAFT_708200 [Russula aff. rugulosa BPL654]